MYRVSEEVVAVQTLETQQVVEMQVLEIICWKTWTHMDPFPPWQGQPALLALLGGHHILETGEGRELLPQFRQC